MSNQASEFLEQLRDPEFRAKVGPTLLTVTEGDWAAAVAIAAEEGFTFTVDELKAATPKGFFRGAGSNPKNGWDPKTLE